MTREFSKEPPPGHARWQKVGESVYSPYTNTERKVVYIDPCECIKKYYEAAKKAKNSPPPTNDFTGEKAAARTRVVRSFNRFHADVMAYEYGKTSEAIYYNHRPGRWLIATDEQLKDYGFTGKYDLELAKYKNGDKEKSDFKAQVYIPNKQLFCEDMPAVLVFKGTSPNSWEDWFNNLRQGMDIHSDYYDKAVRMAIKKLTRAKKPIVIAGHSLGGGLASACSGACGKDAWTFNAAGLHPNTVTRYKATPRPSKIEAYRHEGDILTALQEPDWKGKVARTAGPVVAGAVLGGVPGALIGGAVAYQANQMPAAAGSKHDIPCCNPELSAMARHEMGNTLESMNKMLLDMEDDLRKQTGVKCDQPVIV